MSALVAGLRLICRSDSIFRFAQCRAYAQKIRPLPQINEDDLEETFVRGSGPGGKT